jgi:hypothetical protein
MTSRRIDAGSAGVHVPNRRQRGPQPITFIERAEPGRQERRAFNGRAFDVFTDSAGRRPIADRLRKNTPCSWSKIPNRNPW